MFLLKDGKVVDQLEGEYDSYGSVFIPDSQREDISHPLRNSRLWKIQTECEDEETEYGFVRKGEDIGWSKICKLNSNDNIHDGIAVIHKCCDSGNIPTMQSMNDPNQGWGDDDPENDGYELELLGNTNDDNSYPTKYKLIAETWEERQKIHLVELSHEKALIMHEKWNDRRERKEQIRKTSLLALEYHNGNITKEKYSQELNKLFQEEGNI